MGRNNRHWHKRPQSEASGYKPPYSDEVLNMAVDGLNLSAETLDVLKKGGVHTVGDIVKRRKNDMYKVQNFNKKKLFEVTNAIAPLKVDFRPDEPKAEGGAPDQDRNNKPQQQAKKGGEEQSRSGQGEIRRLPKVQQSQRPAEDRRGEDRRNDNNRRADDRKQERKGENRNNGEGKNKKGSAAVDFSRIFPREKLVHSPHIEMAKDRFTKFQRAGKWGFKDENGKEVIPPIYTEALNFKEDMAAVEMNGLFGYINRENVLVIPYKYDAAGSFSEGWANVALGEKCGYIDKTGKETVPFIYDAATAFTGEGYGRVKKDGRWGNIRKDGDVSWQ